MRTLLTVALFFSIISVSCGQKITDKNIEAQKLINQAGALIYDVGDGSLAQKNGNLKKSILLAKRAIQLDNNRFVAYQVLMGSYQMLGEPQGTIAACTEWLRNHPQDNETRLKRGVLYHRTKNQDLANKDFNIIKDKLDKDHIRISNKLSKQEMTQVITNAYTYLIIGERKKSLDTIESLCKTFPNDKKIAETYKKLQTLDVEKESI